jgi:hypothetical protein
MEPVKRLGVLLAIGAALLLAGGWLGMPAAHAQERCWNEHINGATRTRRVCEGDISPTPGPGPRPQPTPPPCPNPTEIIVSGPHYDEDRNRCFVIVQVINLCANTPMGDPPTRYVECPKPTTSNPCVDASGNPLFSRDLSPLRPVLVAGDWGRPAMRRAPDLVRGRGPQGT